MFTGTSATGLNAYAPGSSLPLPNSPLEEENLEGNGDSEDTVDPSPTSTKRKRSVVEKKCKGSATRPGRVGGAALLAKTIDRMSDAIESRSTATSRSNTTIKEVMKVVSSLPGAEQGSSLWFFCTRLFLNQEKREMFCTMEDPDLKLAWLKFEMTEK